MYINLLNLTKFIMLPFCFGNLTFLPVEILAFQDSRPIATEGDHPFLLSSLDVRFGARLFQLLLCVLPKRLLFFFPRGSHCWVPWGVQCMSIFVGSCWILLDVSLSFRYHDDLDICDKSGQRFDEWIIDPNNLQLYRKMRQEQFCQRSHAIATWLRKKEHTCFGLLVLVDLEASTKHLQGRPMAMQDSVAAIPNLEPLTNDAQA